MRRAESAPSPASRLSERHRQALWTAAVAAWSLLVHLVFLAGDLLWNRPVSPLFFGDAVHFLAEARHLVEGGQVGAGLPFHPPLTAWILAPLWALLGEPETVYRASKVLMASLNAATVAAVYRLLAPRLAWAGPFCLLLPLAFGEMLLSSSVNSETPYRLLLSLLLLLGWRAPALGGGLHGLAALTRAEHLLVLPILALVAWRRPQRRRWAAMTLAVSVLVIAPWVVAVRGQMAAYNQRFAERLPEPLPEWVPISFYGPLNFALAQVEEGIHFSRRTLPPTQGEAAGLDPTHPTHHELIVHGHRVGLEEIARRPGRFLARSAAKAAWSLRAVGAGWTWRDLPKPTTWTRQPVDLASSSEPVWVGLSLLFAAAGAWRLRADRPLLATVLGLVAYRLAVNVAFFPYLRGMMVAFPALLLLVVAGWEGVVRGRTRHLLAALVLALGLFHLATGGQTRRYLLRGERDAAGNLIDDRAVVLELAGFYEDR